MLSALLMERGNWDDAAIIGRGRTYTYRELARGAFAIRSLLEQASRENIAIFLPNGGDYISAFFAVIMAGMAAFPLHTAMTRHEILPLIKQAGVRTLVTSCSYHGLFDEMPGLRVIYVEHAHDAAPVYTPAANTGKDEPMLLLGTSGTTGKSKIVQLSERNIEASYLGYIDKMGIEESGSLRFILAAPFSCAYGMMILCACLHKSFPLITMDDAFTLHALYKTAAEYKATNYEGGALPIQMMEWFSNRPIPYDVSALKYFGFGGSKISGATISRVMKAYPGFGFFQGYGMTEASPLITKHSWAKLEKPHSVGSAIKGVELAIEADGIITRAPHTKGEILVKGPNVMLGYYKNEAETKKAIKNGYLYTGDIGWLDEDGYLYICGRKKNIIIVRGLNVYPEEVEACIMESPFARDCFVYGCTDGELNERVCADVLPAGPQVTAADIRGWCAARLAEYKRPGEIAVCAAIRKNAAGKTKRQVPPELWV